MAFYFALMNISNAGLDGSGRFRSSSLSRNHHNQIQGCYQRRHTIISYDSDASSKKDELLTHIYRNQREVDEVRKDTKLKNDGEKKEVVTFEKRKTAIKVNNFLKNHTFFGASLPNTKTPHFTHGTKVNEGHSFRLSVYSNHVQLMYDRSVAVQNCVNELIEHKLTLSAPSRRRNFSKSTILSRRRSINDSYSRHTRSYCNPRLRFVENEFTSLENEYDAAIPAHENYIFSSYIYSKKLHPADDSW